MILTQTNQKVKQSFEKLNQDVKDTHNTLSNYSKALDKVQQLQA